MQQSWQQEFKALLGEQIVLSLGGFQYAGLGKDEDKKKLKKKYKRYAIDKNDNAEQAISQTKKLLDQIYKAYGDAAKEYTRTYSIKEDVDKAKTQVLGAYNQTKMMENLEKQTRLKAEQKLKEAQEIEKKEEGKRKQLIEQLQRRIKTVQEDYENAGKQKIQKYRENQTLKHELNKLEPQLATTQSLMDAQLKKKQIQIEIQMTTLKQKIQMMSSFKKMGEDTKQRLSGAEVIKQKTEKRLAVLQQKQGENKIMIARAHLILEDYKQAITKINDLLGKHEKEAYKAEQNLKKKKDSMNQIDRKLKQLDDACEAQKNRCKMLLSIEQNLRKQLGL